MGSTSYNAQTSNASIDLIDKKVSYICTIYRFDDTLRRACSFALHSMCRFLSALGHLLPTSYVYRLSLSLEHAHSLSSHCLSPHDETCTTDTALCNMCNRHMPKAAC